MEPLYRIIDAHTCSADSFDSTKVSSTDLTSSEDTFIKISASTFSVVISIINNYFKAHSTMYLGWTVSTYQTVALQPTAHVLVVVLLITVPLPASSTQ